MSTTDYRNQEALNKALNIYRTYMRSFIIFHLKKIPGTNVEDTVINSVSEWRADEIERSLVDRDIKSIIDIDDFPPLVNANWEDAFEGTLNDDKSFRNQLWLIKTCRDQSWAHPPEGDAESEGTRAYLFLIADVLRKIKKPDKQSEVEAIRDVLFPDTAEHLAEAEERLKDLESEKSAAEKCLADVESEKKKYQQKNASFSKQVDEKENQRKKLDKQLKREKKLTDKYKKDIAGTKQRLEASEAAQTDYKNRLETASKELNGAKAESEEIKEHLLNQLAAAQAGEKGIAARLRAVQNLFTIAAIGEPEVQEVFQSVYPPIETDSTVRILDRRGVGKKNYLLALLEQKQPTLIYVQSEEMADLLLERVVPEKADVIGKCNERTSEAEEAEILEKLENGELIAVVSNTTFSALASSHCIEHFVFCHLVPGLDKFFKRCEPIFTSEKDVYLHLIYNNSEQDITGLNQWLTQKYPEAEALGRLYRELRELVETDGGFIKPESVYDENIYSELDIAKPGIETGLAIFEELQFLERNERGVKVLPDPEKRGLDESEIYCGGEELKQGIAETQAFQLKQPIEQIWGEIQEKLDVDSEQILCEVNTDEMYASVSEVENGQQPTETVENDNTVDGEDMEVKQPPKSTRKSSEPKKSAADKFREAKSLDERKEIGRQVAELRINSRGSKPSWRSIRTKLGLKNDEFHKVVRLEDHFRESVVERIESFEDGWQYDGKLEVLLGFEPVGELLERIEACKPTPNVEAKKEAEPQVEESKDKVP